MSRSWKFTSVAVILAVVFVLGAVMASSVATAPEIVSAQDMDGQVLYGADGAGGKPSNLYMLNPGNGRVMRTIGRIGFAVTGLAFDQRGNLYGFTGANARIAPCSLIRIDPRSGAGTLIGFSGLYDWGPEGAADISFHPRTGVLYGWIEGPDDLGTIDLNTGRVTIVGNSGLSTRGSGLAFSPRGDLYFAPQVRKAYPWRGELRTVDPTGNTTLVALLNTGRDDRIGALAFDEAGTLYGAIKLGGWEGAGRYDLVTINTTTGQVTSVGQTVRGLDAIVFQP